MEKLLRYKYLILEIAAFVALMLLIPSIHNTISTIQTCNSHLTIDYYVETRNQCYVILAQYICYALADGILIFVSYRRMLEKNWIMLAIVVYYLAKSALSVYSIITNQDYSSIYSILIDVFVIVFTILALTNIRFKFTACLFLITDAAFALCNVFTGSAVGLSNLLLSLMLVFILVIYSKQEESEYNSGYYQ